MYGVGLLKRMLIKEAFVAFGLALTVMIPVKLFVIKGYEDRELGALEFGSKNKEQLGSSL